MRTLERVQHTVFKTENNNQARAELMQGTSSVRICVMYVGRFGKRHVCCIFHQLLPLFLSLIYFNVDFFCSQTEISFALHEKMLKKASCCHCCCIHDQKSADSFFICCAFFGWVFLKFSPTRRLLDKCIIMHDERDESTRNAMYANKFLSIGTTTTKHEEQKSAQNVFCVTAT